MTLRDRAAAFGDRHPRITALLILVPLCLLLGSDAVRVAGAHGSLRGQEWFEGAVAGLVSGAASLLVASTLWLLTRRFPGARLAIEVVAAVAAVLLFRMTHPRHSSDAVHDAGGLASVIGVDLLFTALLIFAAYRRCTWTPASERAHKTT